MINDERIMRAAQRMGEAAAEMERSLSRLDALDHLLTLKLAELETVLATDRKAREDENSDFVENMSQVTS